jgi:hypothetical protein
MTEQKETTSKLLMVFQMNLPKEILNIVKQYLYHTRDEDYYRQVHMKHQLYLI